MRSVVPFRSFIVLSTFLLTLLLYIDRVCISVARTPIMTDLHLSDKQMGWALSLFALGYALFQIPAGSLGDRLGPRQVLTMIVSFWSLFTSLTGLAWNFVSLLIARFLFGIGEAGAFPAVARASYSWIPMSERGIVTGINFSGSRFGAAFAVPAIAWLIHATGWRNSFLLLGIGGIAWAVFWFWLFRDDPSNHPMLPETEKMHILASRQPASTQGRSLTLRDLSDSSNVWWMMVQYFCNNYTFFFALTWMFPYLQEKFRLGAVEAGWLVAVPLATGGVGNWLSGLWVDSIFKKGQWIRSRRIPAITGFVLSAAGLSLTVSMDSIGPAVFCLAVTIFGADMTMSPSWSACTDIGKKNSGLVSGAMNMTGNLGAFATSLAFPYLKDWFGSVDPFFFIGSAMSVIGAYCWLNVDPSKPLISKPQRNEITSG